jgi:hypothetical protein
MSEKKTASSERFSTVDNISKPRVPVAAAPVSPTENLSVLIPSVDLFPGIKPAPPGQSNSREPGRCEICTAWHNLKQVNAGTPAA